MTALSRYLDPEVLNRLAQRRIEPSQLVLGNLAGAHKSPSSGYAVEFAGHREYVAGDDLKHLDWRVFYRREKLFVKQYEMETNFVCHLVVDVSESMCYGDGPANKFDYASRLATTLSYAILRQRDRVSFTTVDHQIRHALPTSGSLGQVLTIAEVLAHSAWGPHTDLPNCLNELAQRWGRRQIVMLVSDFLCDLPQLETSLQRLKYDRHQVVLFQTLHHDEMEFPLTGPVRFRGFEESQELLTQADDIRRGYLQAFREHQQQLMELTQRNQCELVIIDTSRDLGLTLIDYLNQHV